MPHPISRPTTTLPQAQQLSGLKSCINGNMTPSPGSRPPHAPHRRRPQPRPAPGLAKGRPGAPPSSHPAPPLRLANALGPDIAHTFHAAHGRAANDQQRLLTRLDLLLLLALAKQGSVWQALRLFWTLNCLDSPADDPHTLPARRAATALVDALLARNKLDAAKAVLDRLALQDWLGPVYRRYLLSLLHVKGARGDVGARIGPSDDAPGPATGRNKRARGLHLHDARMPVAGARIEALGVHGKTAAASAVFRDTLGAVAPRLGEPGQLPDLYAEMMGVHLKADDPVAIEGLLAEMASRSDPHGLCRPDKRHFNILLQAYANRTDTDGCTAVLDRMARADIRQCLNCEVSILNCLK